MLLKKSIFGVWLFFFVITTVHQPAVYAEQNAETKVGIELTQEKSSTSISESTSDSPKINKKAPSNRNLPRTGSRQEELLKIGGIMTIGIATAMSYLYYQKLEKRERHD